MSLALLSSTTCSSRDDARSRDICVSLLSCLTPGNLKVTEIQKTTARRRPAFPTFCARFDRRASATPSPARRLSSLFSRSSSATRLTRSLFVAESSNTFFSRSDMNAFLLSRLAAADALFLANLFNLLNSLSSSSVLNGLHSSSLSFLSFSRAASTLVDTFAASACFLFNPLSLCRSAPGELDRAEYVSESPEISTWTSL
mmetsp:Transcript_47137/g.121814  ORF Transcript_47137/g.121814 Transcript_47137/m.121814 type:complete len:200 (-) Transcript_47137:240-839(-)